MKRSTHLILLMLLLEEYDESVLLLKERYTKCADWKLRGELLCFNGGPLLTALNIRQIDPLGKSHGVRIVCRRDHECTSCSKRLRTIIL
ncbi:MAG: hypothetical protein JOY96_04540 [Verrucomicrobia bacterium]|nr:hypothetical protein [Verrucomicrobiota bacterium]